MSVRVADGVIFLEDRCLPDDSETLLLALVEHGDAIVDISAMQNMHLAVAQVLLALEPKLRGVPDIPDLTSKVFASTKFQ